MRIQHNMQSLNANRNYNVIIGNQSKTMEKLSSGYRINRAADDAAGLTISEKMRYQIRGLNQAGENAQDGISLLQVAEGALNETHALLQRIRELTVQAANDTNAQEDREAIQREVDQLTEEIDRIAKTTTFNGDIKPLSGGRLENEKVDSTFLLDHNITEHTVTIRNMASNKQSQWWDGVEYQYGESATLTYINVYLADVGHAYHVFDGDGTYDSSGKTLGEFLEGRYFDGAYSMTLKDLKTDEEGYVYYTSKQDGQKYYMVDNTLGSPGGRLLGVADKNKMRYEYLMNPARMNSELMLQVGAKAGQKMKIDMVDATAEGIGLGNIDVTSYDNAMAGLGNIDAAISKVSEYRSTWGHNKIA